MGVCGGAATLAAPLPGGEKSPGEGDRRFFPALWLLTQASASFACRGAKERRSPVLGCIPLVLLASAFIVICCDPELRDAEPVVGNKCAGPDGPPGAYLHCALAAFG